MKERRDKGLYWDKAWKLVEGCTKVSPGCDNCWSEQETIMRCGHPNAKIRDRARSAVHLAQIPGDKTMFDGRISLREDNLGLPLQVKKPTVFAIWNDLFHEDVPDDFRDRAYAVMALCPQHTFLILSKRASNMPEYLNNCVVRVSALVHNANYEKRRDIVGKGGSRRDGDRRLREDLASQETPRQGCVLGRRLREGQQGQPMPEGPCGVQADAGVSSTYSHGGGSENDSHGAQGCVGSLLWANTRRTDDQPQERDQARQQAGELGIDDYAGAEKARAGGLECQQTSTNGECSSKNISFGVGCAGNQEASRSWDDGEGYCCTIRDEGPCHISNMHRENVEAHIAWPLPNVWHGVTAENQQTADERIPHLLRVPGKRFISVEPMLSAIDLSAFFGGPYASICEAGFEPSYNFGIDAILLGGESGKNARPMEESWARDVRDQCAAAGVPFFFKQWGEFCAPQQMTPEAFQSWDCHHGTELWDRADPTRWRIGKRLAGRMLDERLHDDLPWSKEEVYYAKDLDALS